MRTRDYKNFSKDNYYHIYNRGNNKEVIFRDKDDYVLFLSRLKENLFPELYRATTDGNRSSTCTRKALPSGAFSLLSYCLMPNHFHFLIKQNSNLPINALISKVCTSYSMCFNLKYKQTGSV